ncbi:hypothetical protein LUZ60_007145 [Juncus effusus]|nr:hypothetical protein LUZ60_007145 [Juncus effusus]
MDLQTENRIATMLLEEARRLRAEAEKEGVQAYLNKPSVRARPNSRFLTATVLGVQQANRAVEVNEMWRAREKEKELEDKLNRSKFKERESRNYTESSKRNHNSRTDASCSSQFYERSNSNSNFHSNSNSNSDEDRGFRDDEIEEFLRSRRKRGRGEIGSRMDEPGPYLTSVDQSDEHSDLGFKERRIVGPEKPSFLKSKCSEKKDKSGSKDKKDKKRKEKREEKKKKKKEKKSKGHHHKKRRREYDD